MIPAEAIKGNVPATIEVVDPVTETVPLALLTLPHALETRTQYEVVMVGLTVMLDPVVSGVLVVPVVPCSAWGVSPPPRPSVPP